MKENKECLQPTKKQPLSYEQAMSKISELNGILDQNGAAFQQLQHRYSEVCTQLNNAKTQEVIAILEFSFKVISNKEVFPEEFVQDRVNYIRIMLSGTAEDNTQDNSEE